MQISINTYRWTAFAFNGLTDRTTYKGSTLFFNQPTRSVRATACGKGCYVTGFSPLMEGTRTDKDENGTVTGTVDIAYDINFRTVRFETNEQINAFGGENGVMNTLKRENMNMLMIGTVKNDLLLGARIGSTEHGRFVQGLQRRVRKRIYDLHARRRTLLGLYGRFLGFGRERHRGLHDKRHVVRVGLI